MGQQWGEQPACKCSSPSPFLLPPTTVPVNTASVPSPAAAAPPAVPRPATGCSLPAALSTSSVAPLGSATRSGTLPVQSQGSPARHTPSSESAFLLQCASAGTVREVAATDWAQPGG